MDHASTYTTQQGILYTVCRGNRTKSAQCHTAVTQCDEVSRKLIMKCCTKEQGYLECAQIKHISGLVLITTALPGEESLFPGTETLIPLRPRAPPLPLSSLPMGKDTDINVPFVLPTEPLKNFSIGLVPNSLGKVEKRSPTKSIL